MRKLLIWSVALLLCISQLYAQVASTLTVDKIMQDPKWIGTQPSNIIWSRDSKQIYFDWNPDNNISDSVYFSNIAGVNPTKASNYDATLNRSQSNGSYNATKTKFVYSHKGDIYLKDVVTNKQIQITATTDNEFAPKFLHKDQSVVYTKNQNLFVWNIADGTTKQLTNFVAGEKPSDKKSPISKQDSTLAAEQLQLISILKERKNEEELKNIAIKAANTKESPTPIYLGSKSLQSLSVHPEGLFYTFNLYTRPDKNHQTIVPNYVTESSYTENINSRTNVGENKGKYDFFLFDVVKDTLIKIDVTSLSGIKDLPDYTKDYPHLYKDKTPTNREVQVSGTYWNSDGTRAVVNVLSQDNKDRWIAEIDVQNGKLKNVDRQRDEAWIGGPGIGLRSAIGWIDNETIWYQSEATGYSHIYSANLKTGAKRQITKGQFEIQSATLSTDKKWFYVLANPDHPGEKNWYRISLKDDSKLEKITSMTGGYEVTLSPDEKWIAYLYSYINKPWELYVQENKPGAKPVQITNKAISKEFATYAWREPEITTFKATDGALIHARIYKPSTNVKNGAAVIFVHGAGYLQNAHKWWSSYFREYMFHNLLADEGYTVLDIDYRGSAGYGRDWRTGIYRHMGGKDLDDHVDAAKWLAETQGIDPTRIGIYGGSYGGFITLMGMFTKPGVFKAGAALRSVTDWAHYNHGYTSNILNEPFTDSIAYRRSSPIYFAEGFTKGRLLICHGMVDTNVHFQDVVRLTQRLIELKKENWEMAIYPMEDHGFVTPSSWTDEYKRILKLFREELGRK